MYNAGKYFNLLLGYSLVFIFLMQLFYILIWYVKSINKVKKQYIFEIVENNMLNELYYCYALDSERLIFTDTSIKKSKNNYSVFVLYIKEKTLYKVSEK